MPSDEGWCVENAIGSPFRIDFGGWKRSRVKVMFDVFNVCDGLLKDVSKNVYRDIAVVVVLAEVSEASASLVGDYQIIDLLVGREQATVVSRNIETSVPSIDGVE